MEKRKPGRPKKEGITENDKKMVCFRIEHDKDEKLREKLGDIPMNAVLNEFVDSFLEKE